LKRRDFVKGIGAAGAWASLPWRGAHAEEPASAPASETPAPIDDPGEAGAAWQELVEVLRTADRSFLDGKRGRFDDEELAYAYRNLTHMLAFATQLYMYGDPDAPIFLPVQDAPFEKTLGGHPDVQYAFAPVRGDRRYKIKGRRGDEAYLAFTLHRGRRGSGFEQAFDSHINHHDLKTDARGDFEILVSPSHDGASENWLRASPDATEVYARVYLNDAARDRPARFQIEALDPPPLARPGRADVARRLREMAQVVKDLSLAMPQPLRDPNKVGELWQIDPKGPSQMWQALDNIYCRGSYALEPGQALLLEGTVVPCDYWGVQLWNPFLGSGDYRLGPVCINRSQARIGKDGAFRVAIAREDPKVPGLDWISTAGERQGTFFIRWMCAASKPTAPTARLVSLAALRDGKA
jgi:Protein of unknown function (DUF1214)